MTDSKAPALVCFPFAGDTLGGSHIATALLVRNLDRQRYQPIVAVHQDGPLTEYFESLGVSSLRSPGKGYVTLPYKAFRNLRVLLRTIPARACWLRRNGIAVVHTNDFQMHLTWLIAARLAGCKAVWHQHTPGFGPYLVKNWLVRLAHRFLCVSRFTARDAPPAIAHRIAIVNNPFDMGRAPPDRGRSRAALVSELRCETNSRIVGFFGNLVEQKRPLVFVRAAALIAEALDRPVVFALFGADRGGGAETVRRSARELGIDHRIRLMGFRLPVEPWMAACDVVLAPAVNEGFGRSLVEALAVGTPVVAASSGGHREIIRDGESGLLVPPDDVTALADAALRVLQDSDYAGGLAERALAHVRQAYSLDQHATAIMRSYDELLARGNPAAVQEAAVFRKPG